MPKKLSKKARSQRSRERALLEKVHLNAAGIDVGAATHWVAVPEDRDENPVRSFGVFTSDLIALCEWLKRCQIETVAMESTAGLLDSAFSSAGAKRIGGSLGQRQPCQERSGAQERRQGLPMVCNNSTPSEC